MMTYVYLLFPSVPFLHVLGPKGTGKSQVLDVLQSVVRAGYKGRVTVAATGDMIEAARITPLFDQTDSLATDMVDMLADSYRDGAKRTVVNMEHRGVPLQFSTFGPKAFA